MLPDLPIRVLVVDSSPTVRCAFDRSLSARADIRVVGMAANAYKARELIIAHRPHVIVLNVELPGVSGITFLHKLMAHYPVPVIICADSKGPVAEQVVKALEAGAVDAIHKPAIADRETLGQIADSLAEKIHKAVALCPIAPEIPESATADPESFRAAGLEPARFLVAIGASTGGPDALTRLLENVPADFPPTAIVQHIPPGFTQALASRLDGISRVNVREAVDGERLEVGTVLVGRAGVQMELRQAGTGWCVRYGSSQLYNRHCPSVDVLFGTAARSAGSQGVGVILTGMGDDGARGLLAMHNQGALTIGQTRESCVVYGMPKEAAECGAVQHVAAPAAVPRVIRNALRATTSRQQQPVRM